jgi:hypothetical protein
MCWMGTISGRGRRSICGRRCAQGRGKPVIVPPSPFLAVVRAPAIVNEPVGRQWRGAPQCPAAKCPPFSCRPRRWCRCRAPADHHNPVQCHQITAQWSQSPTYRRLFPSTQHRRQGLQCGPRSIVSSGASLSDAACYALARLVRMAPLAARGCPAVRPRQSIRRFRCGRPNWLPEPDRVWPQPRRSATRCARPCALPEKPSPALAPASTRTCTQLLRRSAVF